VTIRKSILPRCSCVHTVHGRRVFFHFPAGGGINPHRFCDEAREIVRQLRTMISEVVPNASYLRNPEHRELFLSGLRLAAGEVN
jgi:hypothetical protein